MSAKAVSAQVMTANRLRDGDVVYLAADGAWSPWLREAAVARDESGRTDLESRAAAAVERQFVVGPYLMAVAESEDGPQPIGTREKIRAQGPTVHPQFGKQAMAGGANETGANETGANQIGAPNEIGANETGANEIGAKAGGAEGAE